MQPGSARFAVPAIPAVASPEGGDGAGTNRLCFSMIDHVSFSGVEVLTRLWQMLERQHGDVDSETPKVLNRILWL